MKLIAMLTGFIWLSTVPQPEAQAAIEVTFLDSESYTFTQMDREVIQGITESVEQQVRQCYG